MSSTITRCSICLDWRWTTRATCRLIRPRATASATTAARSRCQRCNLSITCRRRGVRWSESLSAARSPRSSSTSSARGMLATGSVALSAPAGSKGSRRSSRRCRRIIREQGEFRVRVELTAERKPDVGFPILEVFVGYRPDTQILFRSAGVVEITSADYQVHEFRGRLENHPLPVRGQGKYPGLVVMARNIYDDGSPLPKRTGDKREREVSRRAAFAGDHDPVGRV